MAYAFDIANPLLKVLEHTAKLPPHRIAGYAANADFWLSEIEHCFALLDGYEKRFYAMRHATTDYLAKHPLESEPGYVDTRTTHNIKDFELKQVRDSLAAAGRNFFRRCREFEVISQDQLHRADQLLNLEREDAD